MPKPMRPEEQSIHRRQRQEPPQADGETVLQITAEVPAGETNQGSCAPGCGKFAFTHMCVQDSYQICEYADADHCDDDCDVDHDVQPKAWYCEQWREGGEGPPTAFGEGGGEKCCWGCGWELPPTGVSHSPGGIGPETQRALDHILACPDSNENSAVYVKGFDEGRLMLRNELRAAIAADSRAQPTPASR